MSIFRNKIHIQIYIYIYLYMHASICTLSCASMESQCCWTCLSHRAESWWSQIFCWSLQIAGVSVGFLLMALQGGAARTLSCSTLMRGAGQLAEQPQPSHEFTPVRVSRCIADLIACLIYNEQEKFAFWILRWSKSSQFTGWMLSSWRPSAQGLGLCSHVFPTHRSQGFCCNRCWKFMVPTVTCSQLHCAEFLRCCYRESSEFHVAHFWILSQGLVWKEGMVPAGHFWILAQGLVWKEGMVPWCPSSSKCSFLILRSLTSWTRSRNILLLQHYMIISMEIDATTTKKTYY